MGIIDPHRNTVKKASMTSPAGIKKKLSTAFEHVGHRSTFESVFGLNTQASSYQGTIFRFPLRQVGSSSEISSNFCTPEMIQERLFNSLKEECSYLLLFLKNVKSISFLEWTKRMFEPRTTFSVDYSESTCSSPLGIDVSTSCEAFARQCSKHTDDAYIESNKVFVEIKTVSVNVNDVEEHHWLVVNAVSSQSSMELAKELMVLPWVGLASKLPAHVDPLKYTVQYNAELGDHHTLNTMCKQLRDHLKKSRVSVKWSKVPAVADGHAYCFLPLPECTAMSVHVHGYFAVNDNRRSIKWPAHDEKGKEAQWNRELLTKMVAPAYTVLLAGRASLIHYESTPLPIANTDHMTDAYAIWPLYPNMKNVPIWNELLSPTFEFCFSQPLLWTSAGGGQYIQFNNAHFLPGTFSDSSCQPGKVVIQLLIDLNINIVCVPKSICETLRQNKHLVDEGIHQEVCPKFVRCVLKQQPHPTSSLTKKDILNVLEFVLSDLNESTYSDLIQVPLLILKGSDEVATFEAPNNSNDKFIFPVKSKSLIELLPGTDGLIVDPELPKVLTKRLCAIASFDCLQLREVNTDVMCKNLLPVSIKSWCTEKTEVGWKWTPGQQLMPARSWMDALWKWIGKCSVHLSNLKELPIVPVCDINDGSQRNDVILVEPMAEKKLCWISNSFSLTDRVTLFGILKSFNFLVADVTIMSSCNKREDHPDFNKFIPELCPNLELIVEYLSEKNASHRFHLIQSLQEKEKDFLRKQFSILHFPCERFRSCLRSIPIYRAETCDKDTVKFIAIDAIGNKHEAFLPPGNMPLLPLPPPAMLSSNLSLEERLLYENLSVKCLSISELCKRELIPMMLDYIKRSSNKWSLGDDLLVWILKQEGIPETLLESLSELDVIFTHNHTHRKPLYLFDPEDEEIMTLFDVKSDKDLFPVNIYFDGTHTCKRSLLKMGVKSWKYFQKHVGDMKELLHRRMTALSRISNYQLVQKRSQFILEKLAQYHEQLESLSTIPFLKADPCPDVYPVCLKESWCGQSNRLYCIEEICLPDSSGNASHLIGTILPILSMIYLHTRGLEKLKFRKIHTKDVLNQLRTLQRSALTNDDVEKFDRIVLSVYSYLHNKCPQHQLPFVWHNDRATCKFLAANKFILEAPKDLVVNLEPYYYCLKSSLHRYECLFQHYGRLSPTDVAGVINRIKEDCQNECLTKTQLEICISVLSWLCEKEYRGHDVLMITEQCTLVPVTECVFDYENWRENPEKAQLIKTKSLLFVHDRISRKVAKHFKVVPLSRKVAPSEKLNFSIPYIRAGQHEDITQRIRHIVEEYQTNIDIFKELIQNADDARATEIKFLIDWRKHPTKSLISEELMEWQGPALIAYNNATFSDEDFDNICKVAGETKRTDPLKTGRFGVGFCATYHITDLPSFISRMYFAMFDPHVTYLSDRVSSSQPGMRIDLVENQKDLRLYQDQFKPYEGVFGCDVFKLSGDGFQGTLFRFPFRSPNTASKICQSHYSKTEVSELVKSLMCDGDELVLFLKHVRKISLSEVKEGSDISTAHELFSVTRDIDRTGKLEKRIQLISGCNTTHAKERRFVSNCFNIHTQFPDDASRDSKTTWIMSTVINSGAFMDEGHLSQGLLPLAEVAVKVEYDPTLCPVPIPDSNNSKVFCFLPLPIKSGIPFHINGFFSVGKDRRSIAATDDDTFGTKWNIKLTKGPLLSAFINILIKLCDESRNSMQKVCDKQFKDRLLSSYYSLWDMSNAHERIIAHLAESFREVVPTVKYPLVWCDVNGGCWLPPTDIELFTDRQLQLVQKRQDIADSAIKLLLHHHRKIVVDLPPFVYGMFINYMRENNRLYNYKRFCEELMFPEIAVINPQIRLQNVLFLVEQFCPHDDNHPYSWARRFLETCSCVPCQMSDKLKPTRQLIDPQNTIFKELFDANEGRFPCDELQKSITAMRGLKRLGMASVKLSIADLKSRAASVCTMTIELACTRSNKICEYIESVSDDSSPNDFRELLQVVFLPVKPKPVNVNVPWFSEVGRFGSPRQLYSPEFEHLVFSQYPIANIKSRKILSHLGIKSKKPTMGMVIAHLKLVTEHIIAQPDKSEATITFLDEIMSDVWHSLEGYTRQQIKDLASRVTNLIWQDGHFLSTNQVVLHWDHSCVPYLCELSSTNKKFKRLMTDFGVREAATIDMMKGALESIAKCTKPLDSRTQHFVEAVARSLESEILIRSPSACEGIYLPDEEAIMRPVAFLAENVSGVEKELMKLPLCEEFMHKENSYFVHSCIPRQRAIKLGVKPLLEAVLKEIEDETFGSEFGQHEELCDRLNGILKKYPPDVSIFKEFIQNADDAQATEIVFVLDHRRDFPDDSLLNNSSSWKSLQHTPALCIFNNRKFTEEDIEGISRLGRGGKGGSPELIGKFGIGFNVAYHVTDCPSFVSYGNEETPEYFCVFDPTMSFVPSATKRSPGRKWCFKSRSHYTGFSHQFLPYLVNDLPKLSKNAPNCLMKYQQSGFVVFRLPLTRCGLHHNVEMRNSLESGFRFNISAISKLFDELATDSKDLLLFLNHIKSLSSFEILKDGKIIHHFTTFGETPSSCRQKCEQLSKGLKVYTSAMKQDMKFERVSVSHDVKITHVSPDKNRNLFYNMQKSRWIVQRAVGVDEMHHHKQVLGAGLLHGLRPTGGIAALLTEPTTTRRRFSLFCFLPLPISSNLPVHVNGHFLVDDSRKHLEKISHEGLGEWNIMLAQCVVVPTYIDLIISAKGTLNFDVTHCSKYYELFPKLPKPEQSHEHDGELSNLNIIQCFYKELLQRNPDVLIKERSLRRDDTQHQWMKVKNGLFCVTFVSEKTKKELSISANLYDALVSIGLPITSAPQYIYNAFSLAKPAMATTSRVDPNKIVNYLQGLNLSNEHVLVIKKCIEPLLQYCISEYSPRETYQLFKTSLYLISKDGSLQRGYLYQSQYSDLVPHCANRFIDPKLEKSDVGQKLQGVQCNVIQSLPLQFVSKNIKLPTTKESCAICEDSCDLIRRLWEFMLSNFVTNSYQHNIQLGHLVSDLFHDKAIVPASDGKLYPLCLSGTLVWCVCNECRVMIKLGYPKVDFSKIKFTKMDSLRPLNDCLAGCFREWKNILKCFQLQEPSNYEIKLSQEEALLFSHSIAKASTDSLKVISGYLLKIPLFFTIDETCTSLKNVAKVFILESTTMPLEGIPNIHNGRVVLRPPDKGIANLYRNIIPRIMCTSVNQEELYLQHVLPLLPQLEIRSIVRHVQYLCINRKQMPKAYKQLKETAFIELNGRFYKPCQLCDYHSEFFQTFMPEFTLPDSWQQCESQLKMLDLRVEVTTEEWLKYATDVSKGAAAANCLPKKSIILQKELIVIITTGRCSHDFLKDVADIEFIYCPQNVCELKLLLSDKKVFSTLPESIDTENDNSMVKVKGSVSFLDSNLACLCRTVLPNSCQPLMKDETVRKLLGMEVPLSYETVVENLKLVCRCARSYTQHDSTISEVLCQVIEKHYSHLCKASDASDALSVLRDEACILISSNSHSALHLVKPSQLVMQMPSSICLEPYCYTLRDSLLKYKQFLIRVGVQQKLNADGYISILANIRDEITGMASAGDVEKDVIKSAYYEVIRCLRQDSALKVKRDKPIYLPDENMNLTVVSELHLNDAEWYKCRLPKKCDVKIILRPPVDDSGHCTLPDVLKVKKLSEVVTEDLDDSNKVSEYNICPEEDLYMRRGQLENKRCIVVSNIVNTLKSDELCHAFYRMYFNECGHHPTEQFMQLVKKLREVKVKCILEDIQTVLKLNGKVIKGTEESDKFCHLRVENGNTVLYISPHNSRKLHDGSMNIFLKNLAWCISKVVDSKIKNLLPIAAIFECEPSEIPSVLSKERIAEYDMPKELTVKRSASLDVAWDKLTPQDFVIMLNFEVGDYVYYLSDDGSLTHAEVLSCHCTN